MDKNMDWIYRPINEPDLESILAEVEKALGFKLFVWQKTFIATGVFALADLKRIGVHPDYLDPENITDPWRMEQTKPDRKGLRKNFKKKGG